MHITTFLYRVNITLRPILTKLAVLGGGPWGARYPRRKGLFLIKLCMHLLLGDMLNICKNKRNHRLSFFGVAQKPKFKHKKGGGGGPNSNFEKQIVPFFMSIICLSTLKISAL